MLNNPPLHIFTIDEIPTSVQVVSALVALRTVGLSNASIGVDFHAFKVADSVKAFRVYSEVIEVSQKVVYIVSAVNVPRVWS